MKWTTETYEEKTNRLNQWHKWFAWYPILIKDRQNIYRYWLCNVYRRGSLHVGSRTYWWHWQYTLSDPNKPSGF